MSSQLSSTVAIITGGSNGIGAAVATRLNRSGAMVIIVDLPSTEDSARKVIDSLSNPLNARFMPADIANWEQLRQVFDTAHRKFGRLDLVIANAGTMEYRPIFEDRYDKNGALEAPTEAYRTIDVNLKGTLHTLKLAIHYLKSAPQGSPKSIILLASTAGYFDGAGTIAYTASKHGVVGLLRSSQSEARKHNIRVNAIAPFFTTTYLTEGIADAWVKAGLEVNSPDAVAEIILSTALDSSKCGTGTLVAGKYVRELEDSRMELLSSWVGEDVTEFMGRAGQFFNNIGGYVLPVPQKD